MPFASAQLLKATQETLLTGNLATRMAMLRSTPIAPPNGATGMAVWEKGTATDGSSFKKGTVPSRAADFSKIKIRNLADMVGFIKMDAVERDFIGAMTFVVKLASELKTQKSRKGWVPCWFLPWMSARIFKLKIVSSVTNPILDFGDRSIENCANPDLFFTAAINGCSVFSIGDATSPNVYHGGINPGCNIAMPLNPNETTEAAWQRLLKRNPASAKFVGSVGKTDYISELNPNPANDADRTRLATARATALEQQLQGNAALNSVMVIPWGAVFGLRDSTGAWHMNLVKNATVMYRRANAAMGGEMMPKVAVKRDKFGVFDHKATAKAGTGSKGVAFSERTISTCINLGYQQFFPGAGQTNYKNLGSIAVY